MPHYKEALALAQRIDRRPAEAQYAGNLGNVYLGLPGLRDLDQAEHWFRRSLSLRTDDDRFGRAGNFNSLGTVAMARFDDALVANEAEPVLLEHLNAALHSFHQALDLTPVGDHAQRSLTENHSLQYLLGAGHTSQALRHYQQSIKHAEARGDVYSAGTARYNIAMLLADDGRVSDALQYARAALRNYQQAGSGAADRADRVHQVIADLEQRNR